MQKCPSCGKSTSGKFCSSCGAPLEGQACRSCGSGLTPGDRFCHKCGASAGGTSLSRPAVPWIVAGAAVAILVLVVIVRFTGGGADAPAAAATPAASPPASGMVDLAQITPREAADRLFDRIMRAHEAGNQEQVDFFLPMAVQSYTSLGELDPDARYHLGLIQTVGGQLEAGLSQADSLEAAQPTHLFASLLRATAARMSGDSTALRRAYRQFVANYEAEIATGRPEYAAHQTAIDDFRAAAEQPTGN